VLLWAGRPQGEHHRVRVVGRRAWARAEEKRRFGTFTADLLQLADWLQRCGVTHVAMEATGVYWKPVWNILDGQFAEVLLVNAQHIKAVPGRKTDQKDSELRAAASHTRAARPHPVSRQPGAGM